MTQSRVLVVAHDIILRQSLEFALAAEGYAVSVYPEIGAVPADPGYDCLVLDETELSGAQDEIAAFCARFDNVVVLADQLDGFVAGLGQSVVAKPLAAGAVTAAVRGLLSGLALST